jgi:hypothetical protein
MRSHSNIKYTNIHFLKRNPSEQALLMISLDWSGCKHAFECVRGY